MKKKVLMGYIKTKENFIKLGKVMKENKAPTAYPMRFRDKIDEYLWKEHHIIGGCCSSIEEMKYSVAREVAEKLTDACVEKAATWIANRYQANGSYLCADDIDDFRKYMKGE